MTMKLWMLADQARALRDALREHGESLGMTDRESVEAFHHADNAYEAIRNAEGRIREARRGVVPSSFIDGEGQ